VVGDGTAHVLALVPVQRVEDRHGDTGSVEELGDTRSPGQVGAGALAGKSPHVVVGRLRPSPDALECQVEVMAEERPDRELGGQPARELGEERHGIHERVIGVLLHSPTGDRGRDRPDQPPAERRRSIPGRTDDVRQGAIVTGNVLEEGVAQQIGAPAGTSRRARRRRAGVRAAIRRGPRPGWSGTAWRRPAGR